jgi:uncharacterized membrane protein
MRSQRYGFITRTIGQVFGFLLGIGAFASGVILAVYGKSFVGAAAFIGGCTTLIGTAVWSSQTRKRPPTS